MLRHDRTSLDADQKAFMETDLAQDVIRAGGNFFVADDNNFYPGTSIVIGTQDGESTEIIICYFDEDGATPLKLSGKAKAKLLWPGGSSNTFDINFSEACFSPVEHLTWALVRSQSVIETDPYLNMAEAVLADAIFTDFLLDVDLDDFHHQVLEAYGVLI